MEFTFNSPLMLKITFGFALIIGLCLFIAAYIKKSANIEDMRFSVVFMSVSALLLLLSLIYY